MSTRPVNWITRTAILMAMTLAFQVVFKLPQPLTGPVVNMFLYLSVILVGMWSGAVIGLATPVIAWMAGIMAVGPLVPVIQLGNASSASCSDSLMRSEKERTYGSASWA